MVNSPAVRLIGIGFYLAFCIVLGTLGGRELDKLADTSKVFTVVGHGGLRQLLDVLAEINRGRTGEKPD
jgi:hypothetical protein